MELPLGTGTIEVDLPGRSVDVAVPAGGEPVDVRRAGTLALDRPHGEPIEERVGPDDEVAVVVTDVTRSVPDDVLLDVLLERLENGGVRRENVTVVIGLGLHRPMTDAEIGSMLGEHADLAINHDPDETVRVGTVDGCPVELHRAVASADVVCSTGVVEPHQYAGFSGGAKTVVIGAGGEPLIRHTHGPEVLARDGVRLGRTAGNPFRELLDRAGNLAGIDCCVNLTYGPEGVLGVAAGDPRAVVDELARVGREALSVPVDRSYDVVVAGVGAPKDANLYQASRAATYVALGDRNPLRVDPRLDGQVGEQVSGRIVLPATLDEGAGAGTGERRFHRRLREATDARALYERMQAGYEPGAQRAFVVAKVLCDHEVWVTNSRHPEVVEECLMHSAPDVRDAVPEGSDVLVVPDALNTLLVRPPDD